MENHTSNMFASIGKDLDNMFSNLADSFDNSQCSFQSNDYSDQSKSHVMTIRVELDKPLGIKSLCKKIIANSDDVNIASVDISRRGQYYGAQ